MPVETPPRFEVSAGPILALGMAPDSVPGVQLGGALRLRDRWWLEADARITPWDRTKPLGITAFDVLTGSGAAALCYRPGAFALCGLVTGGVTLAEAVDLRVRELDRMPFVGLGARLGLQQHLWRALSVRADLEGAKTLFGARINASHRPVAWSGPWAVGVVGARLVWSLK